MDDPLKPKINLVKLSPTAKTWIYRAVGIGFGACWAYEIMKSPEARRLAHLFWQWKTGGPTDAQLMASGSSDVHPILNDEPIPVGFLDMDPEDRKKFWTLMTRNDARLLDLICTKYKAKLCHDTFGLHVDIDCKASDQLKWVERKSVQSCSVSHLDHIYTWSFLDRNDALLELRMNQDFVLYPSNVHDILRRFTNLRKLEVFISNYDYIHPHREVNAPSHVIEILAYHPVTELSVRSMGRLGTRWVVELDERCPEDSGVSDDHPAYPSLKVLDLQVASYFGLNRSEHHGNGDLWINLLNHQKRLTTMNVDCGPTPWDVFAKAIVANEHTLEKVNLWNLIVNHESTQEILFDWNIFKNCKNLTHLVLIATPKDELGPLMFKSFHSGTLKLTTFGADLGSVPWVIYESIIKASAATLVNVCLFRVDSLLTGKTSTFDFSMFRYCKNLNYLTVTGREFSFLNHRNFTTLPTTIKTLDIKWFVFNYRHLEFIAKELPHFEPFDTFMQTCSVSGMGSGDIITPAEVICNIRNSQNSGTVFQKLREYASQVPIFDAAATLYIMVA